MRPDMIPGASFPDYELSDHRGQRRRLSSLQQGDPLVLVLSRGGYCPRDRRQHEGLLPLHREMQVGYCRLVTISTDNPDTGILADLPLRSCASTSVPCCNVGVPIGTSAMPGIGRHG